MRNSDGKSVVARVAAILNAFTSDAPQRHIRAISEDTGIPLSTCHRLVDLLCQEGFLERGADGRYEIGLSLWEISSRAAGASEIKKIALPFMRDLSTVTQHPVHLAVRNGSECVFIERMAPVGEEWTRPEVGSRYPLHVTSVGLILLANASSGIQNEYLSRALESPTDFTVTDPAILRRSLADIRDHGFAVSDRQIRADAFSVAAPIVDGRKNVIAALSVNTPSGSLKEQSMAHAVQMTARAISRAWPTDMHH